MADDSETLVQVTAPHFCAGLVIMRGAVVRAAPILRWSLGWNAADLSAYLRKKGWKATQRALTTNDALENGNGTSAADSGHP